LEIQWLAYEGCADMEEQQAIVLELTEEELIDYGLWKMPIEE
jgi:hypothetical protein